jgi:arabinofuranosyltransferase
LSLLKPSRWLDLLLLTILLLLALGYFLQTELRLTGGRLGVPLDDAWIHYQFARNLAQGNGFSYNPGEPMPGSTAPLWTLLLAVVGLFTEDFLIPSLVLSAFFLAITVYLTYGFTLELAGERWVALLAAVGVILCGRLLWAGLAAMETTAFAATSLAAVWLYHRQGMRPLPALLFALGGQLRPEGHALFALAVADSLWAFVRLKERRPWLDVFRTAARQLLPALLIYALIAAPYTLFSLAVTGHPLPNTFYAKAGSRYFFSLSTLFRTIAYHAQDNYFAILLIPFGLLPAVRRSRLLAFWFIGLPLFTAIVIDFIWHHGRYTLPLVPFQMIVAAMGAQWLSNVLRIPYSVEERELALALRGHLGLARAGTLGTQGNSRTSRFTFHASRSTLYALRSTLFLLILLAAAYRLPYWSGMLGYNSNEILEIDVALGHWLAENTPADALIAVDDIGAITFIAQRPILDLNGLVSPEMWPIIRGEGEGRPRNEATTRLLSTIQPDYLAVFPVWHWEVATNPLVATPLQRFWVATHSIIGEQEAIVYDMTWPYLATANPQVSQPAAFGEAIQLLGYDLTLPTEPAEPLSLTLYWQSLAPIGEGYDVFVHVIGEDGTIVAQADQQPVAGLAPTHRWQPGDIIRDPYTLPLPADLPAGSYRLQIGLYLRDTGARLPTGTPDNTVLLTTFDRP